MAKKTVNVLFIVMVGFYLFIMLDLLFRFNFIFDTNRVVTRSINLIPFKTIWAFVRGSMHVRRSLVVSNLLGNIVVFIPFGFFLQTVRKHKAFWKAVAIIALTSAVAEVIQYIFGLGGCDIDDVTLNAVGGAIGILLYLLYRKVCKNDEQAKTAVTVTAVIVGVPLVCLYFTTAFAHFRF